MRFLTVVFLHLFSSFSSVFAQVELSAPVKQPQFPDIQWYSLDTDANDNLWFGTDNGVYRFDGSFLLHITPEHGLQGNEVLYVAHLPNVGVVSSHFNSKADLIPIDDPFNPKPIEFQDSISIEGFVIYTSNWNKDLILGTSEGQLLQQQNGIWTQKRYLTQHYLDRIVFVHKMRDKKIIGTNSSWHFYDLNDSLLTKTEQLRTYYRPFIKKDTLYALDLNQLIKLTPDSIQTLFTFDELKEENEQFIAVYALSDYHFLLGSNRNGYLEVIINKQGTIRSQKRYLSGATVTRFSKQNQSGIWISTLKHGVHLIPLKQNNAMEKTSFLNSFESKPEQIFPSQNGFYWLDSQNQLHFSGYSNSKNNFSDKSLTPVNSPNVFKQFFKKNDTQAFAVTDVDAWILSEDQKAIQLKNVLPNLENELINPLKSLIYSEESNSWFAASPQASYEFELNKNDTYKVNHIIQGRSTSIVQLKNKSILIGKPSSLVITKSMSSPVNEISDLPVTFLSELIDNSVVVGTNGNGLAHFSYTDSSYTLTKINIPDQMKGVNWLRTFSITDSSLIAQTSDGLCLIYKEKNSIYVKPFDWPLSVDEAILFIQNRDKTIRFWTSQYYQDISHENVFNQTQVVSAVNLSFVKINDTYQPTENAIVLEADNSTVTIGFSSFEQVKRSWITFEIASTLNPDVYTTIPSNQWTVSMNEPGKVSYLVRARSLWTDQHSEPITITLEKKPHWWQLKWIQGLTFVFLMLILMRVTDVWFRKRERAKLKALEEQNALLQLKRVSVTKLLTTHYLFNALTTVRSLAISGKTDDVFSYITRFSKLIRVLIDRSLETEIPIQDELEWIQDYVSLELQAENSEALLHIKSTVDAERFVMPAFILQPIIENALRYGDYSHNELLQIHIEELDNRLLVSVLNPISEQTAEPKNKTSKGLELTHERLKTWGLLHNHDPEWLVVKTKSNWKVQFTLPKIHHPDWE